MILFGIFLSMTAIGFFCWLLFTLAIYALPFFAGVTVGLWAYHTGAGFAGALVVGMIASAATLVLGQGLLMHLGSTSARVLVLLAFVAPAAFAGHEATHGIVEHLMPSAAWQILFSLLGAGAVGTTAFARVTAIVVADPASDRIKRA